MGDLGAGKTHATKGIVAGLGSSMDVSSPTFTLVHEYTGGRLPAYHFDFYRLDSAAELPGIGWDDYLDANGVIIVEWADKFSGSHSPQTHAGFAFHADAGPGGRTVEEKI